MGYGRRGGSGRGRGRYPGNGPFRDLPPWERPGWLYGPGSCWTMGYRGTIPPSTTSLPQDTTLLRQQKELLESQLQALTESLKRIEERLVELEKQ